MQTVLVTGATGCVGSNLAIRLFREGCRVRVLHRAGSHLSMLEGIYAEEFTGDICDEMLLRRAMDGCDTVFHTAALVSFAHADRQEQYRVNVLGTRAVVTSCIASGVGTLVHASSVTTIGYHPSGGPADEETPVARSTAEGYKLSKILAEDEVLLGVAQGLRAVIVNPSVIIGEKDARFHGGQLIRDIAKGRALFSTKGGMNIVYVGDVVSGMILAAARGRSGERYILAGENLTHREIFHSIATLVGGRRPIAMIPPPLLRGVATLIERASRLLGVEPLLTSDLAALAGRTIWFSHAKAERELGMTFTPFAATILAAHRWYKENGLL